MNMKRVYQQIVNETNNGNITKGSATNIIKSIQTLENEKQDIAIIGMAATYPNAKDTSMFWENLKKGNDYFTEFPESRKSLIGDFLSKKGIKENENTFLTGAYIENIDFFDCQFFNITPNEADIMDPNQRLFLQNVYNTIEDAGYINTIKGSRTGIYLGFSNDLRHKYMDFIKELDSKSIQYSVAGNLESIISSRISYFKDLKGPAVVVDTACSSSLVALHLACEAIRKGDCDQAVAGGIKINLLPLNTGEKIGIESSDGRTRSFDKDSDGTGIGEGVASIMIKPLNKALANRDHIYAVIKGSAINQDGSSSGITAPNVDSQIDVLVRAWKDAGINPEELEFIESHGTATQLGDTIEIEALTKAFEKFTNKKQFCGITATKSNIGHLYEASGITGVIKAALCLKNKQIPQVANFHTPNNKIDFENSPLYVVDKLIKWKKDKHLRICGVSSFGFSGTNCHFVMEEAPLEEIINQEDEQEGLQLFTLSAKSKESLKHYVERYQKYLLKSKDFSLKDICHNTNAYKEQFQYRIAVFTDSKADLYNKLTLYLEGKLSGKDILYGTHNIVFDKSKTHSLEDITVSQQKELSKQADSLLNLLDQNINYPENTMNILHELGKLYIDGAIINWNLLYKNTIKKIHLPLYPFAKESHWVKYRDTEDVVLPSPQKALHPFVEQLIVELEDEDIYMTRFSPKTHFILRDHIVLDINVIAGATHLEVLRFVGQQYYETNQLKLSRLEFMMPVFCSPDEYRDVYISARNQEDGIYVTMSSKDDNQEIVTHLTCYISPLFEKDREIIPIQDYINNSFQELKIDQNQLTKDFIEFSGNWLTFKSLYQGEDYVIGEIELPKEHKDNLDIFYLHPGLLDMGINSFSLTIGRRYLPFSFGEVNIYGPTPERFYSITRHNNVDVKGETINFDVKLVDVAGNVFMEVNNYVMKKVHSFRQFLEPNNFYSQLKLEEADNKVVDKCIEEGIAIIYQKKNDLYMGLIEQLDHSNNYIVESNISDIRREYDIKTNQTFLEDYYKNVINGWIENGIYTMIYILDNIKEFSSVEDVEYNCNSIELLFVVMKSIAKVEGTEQLKLIITGRSNYDGEVFRKEINPYYYAAYTLGKTFAKEQGKVLVKSVDLDRVESVSDLLCEINDNFDIPLVVYRKGKRYVEKYTKLNIEEIPERNLNIKEEGTYLITGGSGGIGLTIAQHLTSKQRVNLCLLGRTKLPEKKYWNEIVNRDDDKKLIRLLDSITRLESSGSNVKYITCDVTDSQSLSKTIKEIRKKHGNINGIIHCAGIAGNSFIVDKNRSEFRKVVEPKIYGTVLLHELTKEDNCDFFLLCSSVASVMALPSQGDYSAANAFLDSFAKLNEDSNVVSISWPAWSDIGMAVDHGTTFDTMFKPMASKDAISNMDYILKHKVNHVILGKWNYDERFFNMVNLNVSKEIKALLMRQREKRKKKIIDVEQKVILLGREDKAYTHLEQKLGALWSKVLGYQELNIYDTFYELGGDSILAVKLNNEINNKFKMSNSVSELFDHMTIHELASYISKKLNLLDSGESGLKIKKADKSDYYPTSSGQKRMYFAALSVDNGTLYNIPMIFQMLEDVDERRLAQAFKKLVKRQACLRTGFCSVDGELMQYVDDNLDFDFEIITIKEGNLEDNLSKVIRNFNLDEAPLFRAGMIMDNENRKYLFMDIHHVISDGYSLFVLINDLIAIYNKEELENLSVNYTDYAVWENDKVEQGYFKKQEEYWIEQLRDMPEPINLNYDYPRPAFQSSDGDIIRFELEEKLLKELQELSRKNNVTLFSTLLTGFYIFLHKESSQDDFVVGIPTAGRVDSSLENLVGMFFNTLPIRTQVLPETSAKTLLRNVHRLTMKAVENQQYNYENLIQQLNLQRNTSRSVLFDVLFKLQNITEEAVVCDVATPETEFNLGDITLKTYPFQKHRAKHDLTLEILDRKEYLECYFEYCTKLYKKETIIGFAQHLIQVYEAMVRDTSIIIRDISPLMNKETQILPKKQSPKKAHSEGYVKPQNDLQKYLAILWEKILNLTQVGIEDNFFELGGNSLNILEVQTRIHKDKGIKIPLHELFRNLTIERLEMYIRDSVKTDFDTIELVAKENCYDVSSGQKGLLVLHELNPQDTSYNLVSAFDIRGCLDKEKFERTFQELFSRHEIFRTKFIHDGNDYKQVVEPEAKIPFTYVECTEEQVDEIIHSSIRIFDLFATPLGAITILELSDNRNILMLDVHHIIADGVSVSILVKEFMAIYNGQSFEVSKVQYKDYAVWQNKLLKSNALESQENYWLSIYKEDVPVLNLLTDYPREAVRSSAGNDNRFIIKGELKQKINELAIKTETTVYMILMAAFTILIGKYTDQEDLVIGSPASGRTHEDIRHAIGMFINVLPFRFNPQHSKTFISYLKEVKDISLKGYENQDYPFEKLIEQLNLSGGLERNSLVEVLFAMENIGDTTISIEGIEFNEYKVKSTACKYDLCLYATEMSDTIEFILEYSTSLFNSLTMERLCKNYIQLLYSVIENPYSLLGQLDFIEEEEKNMLLEEFNDTTCDYPLGKTLQQLFEEQVRRTPDNIAITYKEDYITYKELNEKANQIAWTLIKQGVKADDVVGIITDRCIEMMIGIYGIIKAGAAYMPIDRHYPKDRIEYMIENSKANIILAQHPQEVEGYNAQVLSLINDGQWDSSVENPVNTCMDMNLAYIIYTSGTTGKPKGVMIEHRAIVNRLNWMQKAYPLDETDVILQKTTYTFDVSVWEIFWWSQIGARVRMLPQGDEKDPEAIVKDIEDGHVTVMHFVPSMLSVFLAYVTLESCYKEISSLVYVFASGEALQRTQSEVFYREITRRNQSQLVNLYGPTEAAVDVTYFNCAQNMKAYEVYIGKPIDNIQIHILNKNLNLVPIGVAGELCISGIGLARGYINKEELTKEKFLDNPYIPGEKLYKTGDLARWRLDGNIEYLGRIDNQVKIRGFRIELGEIEKVLLDVKQIKDVAVIAREENGEKYICAYYVSEKDLSLQELRDAIIAKLPDYMIPSYFVSIKEIPTTSNGKLNRKALPSPENIGLRDEIYEEAETNTEQIVVEVWQEALGVERIGRNDNFFQMGGHSLKATLVLTKLRKRMKVDILLKEIFQYPVLKDFAKHIDTFEQSDLYSVVPVEVRKSYPITNEQMGIYLASKKENTNYNVSFVSEIMGEIHVNMVRKVLSTIVERHLSLRTSFDYEDGMLVQKISDELPDIPIIKIEDEGEKDKIIHSIMKGFDLDKEPLFRCVIIKEASDKYSLVFNIHHIVFDGFSISNFISEFINLYQNQPVPELLLNYGDYALWQKEFTRSDAYKKQESYWISKFSDNVPKLKLPVDIHGAKDFTRGDKVYSQLPIEGLMKITKETDTTLFMVLLSAYFILLHKYTGQEDIVVGIPALGRKNSDIQPLIGMFVKSIPIRCLIEPAKKYLVFLDELKQITLAGLENQDYSFGELLGKLGIPRDEQTGLFSTMFILENIEYPTMEMDGIKVKNYPLYNQGAKYPIELFVYQKDKSLELELSYSLDLFKKDSTDIMLNDYKKIINSILSNSNVLLSEIRIVEEEEYQMLRDNISAVTDELSTDFMF